LPAGALRPTPPLPSRDAPVLRATDLGRTGRSSLERGPASHSPTTVRQHGPAPRVPRVGTRGDHHAYEPCRPVPRLPAGPRLALGRPPGFGGRLRPVLGMAFPHRLSCRLALPGQGLDLPVL